ncbi:MAG TPA: hypothetical protein VJ553_00950, partial [Candidatus Paceibacterota bacterium]|nr:hypothetical protein [Candidatus Paceibacterota bacterium]
GCKCTWCPGVRAVARLLRRYTWSHEKQTMVECDAGGFVLYTDAVKMQREAFVSGSNWALAVDDEHWPDSEAEVDRRYKEEP